MLQRLRRIAMNARYGSIQPACSVYDCAKIPPALREYARAYRLIISFFFSAVYSLPRAASCLRFLYSRPALCVSRRSLLSDCATGGLKCVLGTILGTFLLFNSLIRASLSLKLARLALSFEYPHDALRPPPVPSLSLFPSVMTLTYHEC